MPAVIEIVLTARRQGPEHVCVECRCLKCGDSYDMPASFRLVQLWLDLAARREMNQKLAKALPRIPSHKFLSLLYQLAARMGDSRSGALAASGFQASSRASAVSTCCYYICVSDVGCVAVLQKVLQDLMVRLGSDHPYHVLYQLLALKHGGNTKEGEASRGGAMHRTLQVDKIQAATAVIDRIVTTRCASLPGFPLASLLKVEN